MDFYPHVKEDLPVADRKDGNSGLVARPQFSAGGTRALEDRNKKRKGENKIVKRKKVFVSFPFEQYDNVAPLLAELDKQGFDVVTGRHVATDINYGIRKKLSGCQCFLSVMFKETEAVNGGFFPAVWLIEEKVAAWMLDIPVVLLLERGVEHCGEMHGNTQRVIFDGAGLWAKALEAIKIIKANLDVDGCQ